MERKYGKLNEEQWAAMLEAMREEKFVGLRIVEELEPIIKEFFVCEATMVDSGLKLEFLNGQKFLLLVKEL